MKKPLVVNLLGGPGVGKSTTSAGLFYFLKLTGYNAELSREYAKDLVWSKRFGTLKDQIYLFGKQHHRLFVLQDDVDIVVTDCPLILSSIYADGLDDEFHKTVFNTFNKYNNLNIFLNRVKPYQPKGRMQTLEESDDIHNKIKELLDSWNIPYYTIDGDDKAVNNIMKLIEDEV